MAKRRQKKRGPKPMAERPIRKSLPIHISPKNKKAIAFYNYVIEKYGSFNAFINAAPDNFGHKDNVDHGAVDETIEEADDTIASEAIGKANNFIADLLGREGKRSKKGKKA